MPFRSVRLDTTTRLAELQLYHRMLVNNERNFPVPPEHQTLKGHFVVGLYAYIEYSLQQTIRSAIAHVNSLNIAHKHIAPELFALFSEPKFMAVSDTTGERRWQRRRELVVAVYADETCAIADSVLSREIQNTRVSTVELVFQMFALKVAPINPATPVISRYINEIGERRNAVAHGRESASEVGGRFTVAALGDRLTALESQTTYMISSFEDAAARKEFIRSNCRRYYP